MVKGKIKFNKLTVLTRKCYNHSLPLLKREAEGGQSGKSGTIGESNKASGVCKMHYAQNYVIKGISMR